MFQATAGCQGRTSGGAGWSIFSSANPEIAGVGNEPGVLLGPMVQQARGVSDPRPSVWSLPVEVDPVQRDRFRVALEQRPRQRHLEVPVLERKRLGRLAVAADDADVRPEGAFLVQTVV